MDVKDYNKCVDLYSDSIFRFAFKSVKDEETANDLVQDAFIRLWQHIEKVELHTAKSYLFKITNNLLIDLYRKNKYVSSVQIADYQYSYIDEYSDIKEHLDKAVNTLSQTLKTILLLRDYEEYSYKEIGEILDLSESQVKVYIFRARKKLKDYLLSAKIEL